MSRGAWVEVKGREVFRESFPGTWEEVRPGVFQGHCPAKEHHSGRSAATDCRVFCGYGPNGQSPGAFCQHESCSDALRELNSRFRDRIFEKSSDGQGGVPKPLKALPSRPLNQEVVRPPYDETVLRRFVKGVEVDWRWWYNRSPIQPFLEVGDSQMFLEAAFKPGERILICEGQWSQGEYCYEVGKGLFRLGPRPGIAAQEERDWPQGGGLGVWFLNQPVTGRWLKKPIGETTGTEYQGRRWTRRSAGCVTSWRYLLLESDDAPPDLWLSALARLPIPIIAIYSSGGRSWHALVRLDSETKEAFDALRSELFYRLTLPLGGDGKAMSAVRLTRLPGMMRDGTEKKGRFQPFDKPKMQRLIYLNPEPKWEAAWLELKGGANGR